MTTNMILTKTQYSTQTQNSPLSDATSAIFVALNESEFLTTGNINSSDKTINDFVSQLQALKKISNYSTGKRNITSWTKVQINKLGQLIYDYGTDFDVISRFMGKNRDQIKKKYKAISKKDNTFGFVSKKN